jgi:hypothetical protein
VDGVSENAWRTSRLHPYVTYVPDELWRLLGTEIHHFEYGKETSVAVYADGRREEFDSKVTPERVEAERAITQGEDATLRDSVRSVSVVVRRDFTGVITGWTR